MTRLGITFEDVLEAAETILSQGENPTIEKIRRELGSGSNSTIAKHLNEWRANRLIATTETNPAPNFPPDSVHAAVNQVWEKLRDESEIKIKTIQDQAQNKIEVANIERDQAIAERDKIQQEFNNNQKRLNQISADKEILTLDLKSMQQEHLLLQEKYKGLEAEFNLFKQETNNQIILLESINKREAEDKKSIISSIQQSYETSISKLMESHESHRQQHIVEFDVIKVEKQQLNKIIEKLSSENQAIKEQLTEAKSLLKMLDLEINSIKQESYKKDKIIENNHSILQSMQLIHAELNQLSESKIQEDILSIIEKFDKQFDIYDEKLVLILSALSKSRESAEES